MTLKLFQAEVNGYKVMEYVEVRDAEIIRSGLYKVDTEFLLQNYYRTNKQKPLA